MVALDMGTALHRGDIRARLRLRKRECGNRLATDHAGQITQPLRRRALQADRARAQPLHGKSEVRQAAVPGQRLAQQANGPRVHRRGLALRAGHGVLEPAARAQRPHQRAAFSVHVGSMDVRDVHRRPAVHFSGQLPVPLFEERPIEVTGIAHGHRAAFARLVCLLIELSCLWVQTPWARLACSSGDKPTACAVMAFSRSRLRSSWVLAARYCVGHWTSM